MRLTDKVALVTGGAHRVGKGIALALAREGAHVMIHYGRSEAEAAQTVAEITALGVQVASFQADLAEPAHIERLFEAVSARFGRLDVLVNSAASFERAPFETISAEQWDRVMAVNLRAPFLCSQQAARLMRATSRADGQPALIVNIADLSGLYPWRGFAHHGISKAGVIHLTRQAARELAPDIRVNALVLGPILPTQGVDPQQEDWQRITVSLPLQRTGSPDEVGQAVVFLAHADSLTGAVITLDSGESLLGPAWH
jgi:pteridine reductase